MILRNRPIRRRNTDGVAVIIVLVFVVLLAAAVIAYLSRTSADRQIAHGDFNDAKSDQLARSALDVIVGDLKQEIIDGSTSSVIAGSTVYSPTPAANVVPQRGGTPATGTPIPNLIRRSIRADAIATPGTPSRASALSSAPSVSGTPTHAGDITTRRWNKHYLIPKAVSTGTQTDPVSSFIAPDWVFFTRDGPSIISSPSNAVLGRYAYAIYDEGGLLDINAAGIPSNSTIFQYGRKGSAAFSDLSASPGPNIPQSNTDNLVGWRGYATVNPSGNFPSLTINSSSALAYFNYVLTNQSGFLKTPGTTSGGRTDQQFASRQELISFAQSSGGFTVNALQYLTHFSREAEANVPLWGPVAPDSINPNFQTLRVASLFVRNDGTTAKIGEPLVSKRFLLQRLNWLTYKGPSGPSLANPAGRPSSDADMAVLINTYGLTSAFLQQGTDANILHYFGLAWDVASERWNYVGHTGSASPIGSVASFGSGGTQPAAREPDFFELLQAGILNSSLGTSASSDAALPTTHQQSKVLHLLTIGANLIVQSRADSYPVRIAFDSGAGVLMEALGSPRLPYVNALAACPVAGTAATGGVNWLLVPNLWDPFRDSWDLTEVNTSAGYTPAYPRPPIRITVAGDIGFGSMPTPTPAQSGSVATSEITTFPALLSGLNSSIILKTGVTTGNAFGRDGLGESSRLATSDFASSPASFITTTSGSTISSAWNSVTRPPRSNGSLQGSSNVVVFRISLPGSAIPSTAVSPPQNPVIILKPGFRLFLEYQSSNGLWYPYSFLQGNNAPTTWISANLNLNASYSQYGLNPSPSPSPSPSPATILPTVINSAAAPSPGPATVWDMTTLASAPMFAKSDPRSIRYNSQIGVLNVPLPSPAPTASPVPTPWSAGIIGSIWPNGYLTPPIMTPAANPASYSQTVGDNGSAASNPYDESISTSASVRPIIMNRPYRSVGEMSYAFRDLPFKTIDFSSVNSPDAGLLDLFTVNEYKDSSGMRAGVINANSQQAAAVAAILKNTIRREDTPRQTPSPPSTSPSPQPSPVTDTPAGNVATNLVTSTGLAPILNRSALASLIAPTSNASPSPSLLDSTVQKTQRESIARALGEVVQTRTWNLMIDVIAQSGRYPPTSTALSDFVVEGEKRYWLHVAIDRFTGEIIDQQLEAVYE